MILRHIFLFKAGALLLLLLFLCSAQAARAEQAARSDRDGVLPEQDTTVTAQSSLWRVAGVGVPLIACGVAVNGANAVVREYRTNLVPGFEFHADDYIQYAPAAVMVGLKAFGVKSRSSWGRMLVSDAFSAAIMAAVVNSLKWTVREMRPDGSDTRSFPSGHTATAFMTATMLSREYGDRSVWYSIGGYTAATATGVMRILNNKHWVGDVLAGAGIGIISTELGYLLADLIFKDKGINHYTLGENFTRDFKPSFLGLYMGMNVTWCGPHNANGPRRGFFPGAVTGLEGAWFPSVNFGLGGRFAASCNSPEKMGPAYFGPSDMLSALVGTYFSYQLLSRLLVGAKVGAGWAHARFPEESAGRPLQRFSSDNMVVGSGIYFTFRARPHMSFRISADYDWAPTMRTPLGNMPCHSFSLAGSADVAF